ncbi:MAG: hypothetical protein WAQ99_05610 [Pyrinomonadaceae bacterium]
MIEIVYIAARVLLAVIGGLLIYVAAFLYETEKKKIQDTLEVLWISIDEKQKGAISWSVVFTQAVAQLTGSSLDRLFGHRIFSLQAIGVSLCYSYASFLLLLFYFDRSVSLDRSPAYDEIILAIYIALGTMPAFIAKRPNLMRLWFVVVLTSLGLFDLFEYRFVLGDSWEDAYERFSGSTGFYIGITIGIVCNIFFMVVLRKGLRWSASLTSAPRIILVILGICLAIFIFFVGPLLYERQSSLDDIYDDEYLFIIWVAVTSNLFIALTAIMFLMLAFGLLVHRIFWPTLNRSIYALQNLPVAKRNSLLWTVGTTLIACAFGWSAWPRLITNLL